MKKEKLIEVVNSCINQEDIRIDLEVLFLIINKNNLTPADLSIYLKSISNNIEFFRKELNYPLQLSNLLHFELDAREINSNRGRGSKYRYDLIESYKTIIQ
jgi:hypothetical protein